MATGKVYNNLIGSSRKAKYPAVQGSELSVNMYAGANGDQRYMESLPGLKAFTELGGKCRGTFVSTIGLKAEASPEDLFVVMGTQLWRVDAYGNKFAIGSVANNGHRVSFAESGGPRPLLLVADGANLWYYDLLNGGELKQIQLPERPFEDGGTVTPSHCSVVDGSICINDTGSGYWYYSYRYPLRSEKREMFEIVDGKVQYEEDGVTVKYVEVDSDQHVFEDDYGVTMYQNSIYSSDNISAIYAIGPTLYVFGPKSVEIFQRGSGDFEDWIRTSYTNMNTFGLEAPDSLASIGGSLFFIASGAQYGKALMKVTGNSFERVSEDWLEQKLLSESTESAYGFAYATGEHSFYCIQLNSLGECWTLDLFDNGWHQRTSREQSSGLEGQWRVGGMAYYREKFWAFTNDGMMCRAHDDYWKEDYPDGTSLPMIRHRQTAVITDGLKPFTFEELTIECNVGTWEDYNQKPMLLLEVSRDGGHTFGNVRSASLGRTGDYSHRVRFMNVGYNRLCVIRVSYSHETDLVLTACSIRAEATAEEM